jgi:hypothetical protein
MKQQSSALILKKRVFLYALRAIRNFLIANLKKEDTFSKLCFIVRKTKSETREIITAFADKAVGRTLAFERFIDSNVGKRRLNIVSVQVVVPPHVHQKKT